MSAEHKHLFWKVYRVAGRWANQHGRGTRVAPDGAVCKCGRRVSEEACRAWYAGVADGTIRGSFSRWATT